MVGTSRARLLRLSRGAWKLSRSGSIPTKHRYRMVATTEAAQPKSRMFLGQACAAGQTMAADAAHPAPMAKRTFCRQAPKVGAGCGKAARPAFVGVGPDLDFIDAWPVVRSRKSAGERVLPELSDLLNSVFVRRRRRKMKAIPDVHSHRTYVCTCLVGNLVERWKILRPPLALVASPSGSGRVPL